MPELWTITPGGPVSGLFFAFGIGDNAGMSNKVFLVDDDANLLSALARQFRKRFDLLTAEGGEETLEHSFKDDPVAVVVSDMRMPDMDGLELLQEVRKISPDTVRIMLTGNADQKTALDAINQGSIFRFYSKPCPPEVLAEGIEEGIAEYKRVVAEKEIFNSTFTGALKALTALLSIADPDGVRRSEKIRRWTNILIPHLKIKQSWRLSVAAMMCPLGCISVAPEIKTKMRERWAMSDEEKQIVDSAQASARDLIANIPRLKSVAKIVYLLYKGEDGSGPPYGLGGRTNVPKESKILKILSDLELLSPGPLPTRQSYELLLKNEGEYDAELLGTIREHLISGSDTEPEAEPEARPDFEARQDGATEESGDGAGEGGRRAPRMPGGVQPVSRPAPSFERPHPHPHPQLAADKHPSTFFTALQENRILQAVIVVPLIIVVAAGLYFASPDSETGQGEVKKHMDWITSHTSSLGLQPGWKLQSVKQTRSGQIDIEVLVEDSGAVRTIKSMPRMARVGVLKFACPRSGPELQKILDDGWKIFATLKSEEETLTGGTCRY